MDLSAFLLDAERLRSATPGFSGPLALIDLDSLAEWPEDPVWPSCPVVGIGDRGHPLADRLDATVEPPVTVQALARQVCSRPLTAAVAVELLRLLPTLSAEDGIAAEARAGDMLATATEHAAWRRQHASSWHFLPAGSIAAEQRETVLDLRLDRLWAGNMVDGAMCDMLETALSLAATDPGITRIILSGNGRNFCLGLAPVEWGAVAVHSRALPLARILHRCGGQVEARVDGGCVGVGLALAAFAGQLTAGEEAWFQLPELAAGLVPAMGACVALFRKIGRQRLGLMLLSGECIPADHACEWGLVDELIEG